MRGLEADADRRAADVEGDRELPRLDVGVGRNVGQRHAPVLAEIDALERAVPAMGLVVAHQPVDQGLARHQLNLGIERGANRKPALVELLFAVTLAELAPHLLGEEAGGDRVGRQHARIDDERLGAGLARLIGGDVAVLGHAPDDVVAPLHRPVVVAERIEGARLLGQRREIGDLRDRKLVHRLVEIVQRGGGDAVVRQAEVDLVEVELEDLLLGIGGLDADAEQDFANLAVERAIRAQEEILRHLLGDGRGALDVARALQEHDAGAHDAFGVEPAVRIEVLVLGGDEGFLDQIGNRGGRQVKPALARIFRQQAAVGGVDAGHHRRLVVLELAEVGQILLVFPDDGAEHRRRDHEDDRAGREYEAEEAKYRAHRTYKTFACAHRRARLPLDERTIAGPPATPRRRERPSPSRPNASCPRIQAGPQSVASWANL